MIIYTQGSFDILHSGHINLLRKCRKLAGAEGWETVEILGKKVKTPYLKEKWLSHYYGKDYMEEKKYWHYSGDSLNRESFERLVKEGEIVL